MSTQKSTPQKSDVSFKSEEARLEREMANNMHKQQSDWRKELIEAAKPDDEGNHPYVDVMPFMGQKEREAKRQLKGDAKAEMAKEETAFDLVKKSMGKSYIDTSKPKKPMSREAKAEDAKRRARIKADNMRRGPMAKDPYGSRAGESD